MNVTSQTVAVANVGELRQFLSQPHIANLPDDFQLFRPLSASYKVRADDRGKIEQVFIRGSH